MMTGHAVVIGAGIGGLTAGVALSRAGWTVAGAPDLAVYTGARLARARMVAAASYRATRLTATTSRAAITARNVGVWLAGHLAPGLMLGQMAPVASWTPPA